jgi:hypothetical protein
MESNAKSEALIFPSPSELILTPHLHDDVLRHIATFLDFQSIRQFRLVCREWNAAGTGILMKRGYYALTYLCKENERSDLCRGASHYSSWKISHSIYESAEILHDNEMWGNVRSLTIHQLIPLSREFHSWAWETIQSRCPNLQEISFIFERFFNTAPESEVESDYERAVEGLPNASFPKISNLTKLVSVHFKGIYDKTTAYFARNLLQACTPNLRHLSFCPITEPLDLDLEVVDAFRIFEYLKQTPSLLKNLQSFAFSVGSYSSTANVDELVRFSIYRKRSRFTKFINEKTSLPLQFSENLQSLFWDSPFHLGDQLLPGVLTPSIASSLVQLCLKRRVDDLDERSISNLDTLKISIPNFPRLRALKMGLFACFSLSVPELVDAAPNLYVLEMKGVEGIRLLGVDDEMSSIWRGSEKESYSNPKHHQLRIFCTDIPFNGLSTLQTISSKFPNLEELRLGTVWNVGFDPFFSVVKSNHSKLQRLWWNFSIRLILAELFHHLVRVPEQLPTLTRYSLGNERSSKYLDISIEDMEPSADILLNLLSNSNPSCLVINLLTTYLNCVCKPGEFVMDDCKQCYLHDFIRKHKLPIQISSIQEAGSMESKFIWDHRFVNCRIYQ